MKWMNGLGEMRDEELKLWACQVRQVNVLILGPVPEDWNAAVAVP